LIAAVEPIIAYSSRQVNKQVDYSSQSSQFRIDHPEKSQFAHIIWRPLEFSTHRADHSFQSSVLQRSVKFRRPHRVLSLSAWITVSCVGTQMISRLVLHTSLRMIVQLLTCSSSTTVNHFFYCMLSLNQRLLTMFPSVVQSREIFTSSVVCTNLDILRFFLLLSLSLHRQSSMSTSPDLFFPLHGSYRRNATLSFKPHHPRPSTSGSYTQSSLLLLLCFNFNWRSSPQ